MNNEDLTELAARYKKLAYPKMHVCGACGTHDPELSYVDKHLRDIGPKHWLNVGAVALERLRSEEPFELLVKQADGAPRRVQVQREMVHNITKDGDRSFHLIPEAVEHDPAKGPFAKICDRCTKNWDQDAERLAYRSSQLSGSHYDKPYDTYDDLYSKNAPVFSIAHGDDFSRLKALSDLGVETAPSALETLVLSEARCHQIVLKLVVYSAGAKLNSLHGHTLIFQHSLEVKKPKLI